MAHPIDLDELVAEIKGAASKIVKQDVAALRGFSERQAKAMAKQAAWIAEATLKGELDDDMRNFFLDTLEDMVSTFAKSLRGLIAVTVEKVWNAVVTVLWKAIEKATRISLPVPL